MMKNDIVRSSILIYEIKAKVGGFGGWRIWISSKSASRIVSQDVFEGKGLSLTHSKRSANKSFTSLTTLVKLIILEVGSCVTDSVALSHLFALLRLLMTMSYDWILSVAGSFNIIHVSSFISQVADGDGEEDEEVLWSRFKSRFNEGRRISAN